MNNKLVQKVNKLPKKPGVYLYRDEKNTVIYVGKAINLRNRVGSYFKTKNLDPKTEKLVQKINSLETIECESEIEALILESELIKRYKPKYNFEWKDDKNYCYIRITGGDYQKVEVIRQIVDHKSTYFGPFVDSNAVRSSLKILRTIFPYCTCNTPPDKVCLYNHIGLCPGHGPKYTSPKEYQRNINNLIKFLKGKKHNLINKLENQMKKEVRNQEYEKAAKTRDKLLALKKVRYTKVFEENKNLASDKALSTLSVALGLENLPKRIECYDISNISGKHAVGSMVVFVDGLPQKSDYRRFEIKTIKKIDDFGMLQEVLKRRFSKKTSIVKDASFEQTPDLIVVDGGKGQLSSASQVLKDAGVSLPLIGLAKRFEEVYSLGDRGEFRLTMLPENSEARFLLQRIRDEAHRFAITYHRNLRSKEITASILSGVDGVGPVTKRKLIVHFGSVKKIKEADITELSKITGKKLAEKIKREI